MEEVHLAASTANAMLTSTGPVQHSRIWLIRTQPVSLR
jgi:hypothetical protein